MPCDECACNTISAMNDANAIDAYVYRLESTLEWISDLVGHWAATHESVAVSSDDPHYHQVTAQNYRSIANAASDTLKSKPPGIV